MGSFNGRDPDDDKLGTKRRMFSGLLLLLGSELVSLLLLNEQRLIEARLTIVSGWISFFSPSLLEKREWQGIPSQRQLNKRPVPSVFCKAEY
jgi:hypothetical protein